MQRFDGQQPAVRMVADPAALAEVCDRFRAAGRFGFDTEFIREQSYLPRLCLVQAATADFVVLIDPLAVDTEPFWSLVADPALQKIVHSGEQDLELCYQHIGRPPANIFDVQVAAGLLGVGYPLGYGKLVEQLRGEQVVSGEAYTNWMRRPLTDRQLRYAVSDVLHLSPLRDALTEGLTALGRLDWLVEEMRAVEDPALYQRDPEQVWRRVKGRRRMTRRELATLRELATWRETAARRADLPARTFLADAMLVAVVAEQPADHRELAAIKGFPRPIAYRLGEEIFAAIARARTLPEGQLPPAERFVRPPDRQRVTELMALGTQLCESQRISPPLFASRSDYAELILAADSKQRRRSPPRLLAGWRRGFAGETLLEAAAVAPGGGRGGGRA